jgi:hypothetical protein
MSGDLAIDDFECIPDGRDWYVDGTTYYWISPDTELKRITLDFSVLKNDIQPGESRNFRLKYRQKDHRDDDWNSYQYSQQFTVSVEDVPISGTAGVLCNSSRTYSITGLTGYSNTWSFSPSNLVTSSSGSGTSASLTGSCNAIGDGTLTFTMTKASCPTLITSRTIMVNGPNHSDLEMNAYYTSGSPAPKSGSTYLLCANTHYHIYLDNDVSHACGLSSFTWTIPTGWTKNYQSSNMISIYTGSSPGGQVSVKGQTCCSGCGSNMSLLTDYFGTYYSCGGYYMASPNPGSEYVDIDYAPEATELKATSSTLDLELKLVDKMGTVVCTENVYSFPYRINTSKLKEGNYLVMIRDKKANSKSYESFQILIEH